MAGNETPTIGPLHLCGWSKRYRQPGGPPNTQGRDYQIHLASDCSPVSMNAGGLVSGGSEVGVVLETTFGPVPSFYHNGWSGLQERRGLAVV